MKNEARPPEIIGIWRLGEGLHRGTHCSSYLCQPADSPGSPRFDYVLKLPNAVDADSHSAFRRFVTVAGRARHPNLIAVLDSGTVLASESAQGVEEIPFLVMPRLGGTDLMEMLSDGRPFPLPVVLWLARQAAAALAQLHSAGFVHGNLRPECLRVQTDGHVTVMDLTHACPVGQPIAGDTASIRNAPEMQKEIAAAQASADIYSLGCVMWQLLSGLCEPSSDARSAMAGQEAMELITQTLQEEPRHRPTAEQLVQRLLKMEINNLQSTIVPARAA
ncbi:MAG: protein kinase [Planctomycetota bacterium]